MSKQQRPNHWKEASVKLDNLSEKIDTGVIPLIESIKKESSSERKRKIHNIALAITIIGTIFILAATFFESSKLRNLESEIDQYEDILQEKKEIEGNLNDLEDRSDDAIDSIRNAGDDLDKALNHRSTLGNYYAHQIAYVKKIFEGAPEDSSYGGVKFTSAWKNGVLDSLNKLEETFQRIYWTYNFDSLIKFKLQIWPLRIGMPSQVNVITYRHLQSLKKQKRFYGQFPKWFLLVGSLLTLIGSFGGFQTKDSIKELDKTDDEIEGTTQAQKS